MTQIPDSLKIKRNTPGPAGSRQKVIVPNFSKTIDPNINQPTKGVDLKIELESIEKNNNNFDIGLAGIYTINYHIVNAGLKEINITNLSIQAYLNTTMTPQGGYSLVPDLLAQSGSNGVLHAGQKYKGKIVRFGYDPSGAGTFILKIDDNNKIAESNENNNSIEIPVRGNLEYWQTPLPDLTFQVNSVTPVPGGGYLNARWEAYLVNSGAGDIPVDILRNILPKLQVYPIGSPGVNLYNEIFPLEQKVTGTQVYPGYYKSMLPLKAGEKINLSIAAHVNGLTSGSNIVFHFTIEQKPGTISIAESSTSNNTFDYVYKVP